MAPSRWRSLAAGLVTTFGCVSLALWSAGVVLHDLTGWSQWLSWIPAPAVALAMGLAAVAHLALRQARARRVAAAFSIAMVAALTWTVHLCVGVHGQPADRARAVRVLQWNTDWPSADDPRSAEALGRHRADLVLNSNPGEIMRPQEVAAWAPDGSRVYTAGPFALVTAWPVLEARQVAAGGAFHQMWFVSSFVVQPPDWDGRPLRIAMVDLPSRPVLPRSEVARALREGCQRGGLGEVDLVAGDFNAIDGSVILSGCFPGHRDALAEAGAGWLCTWPRAFPLWKIDHVLLGKGMRALHARVLDPGTSHHRMTMLDLAPR